MVDEPNIDAALRPLLDRVVPSMGGDPDAIEDDDVERQLRRVQRAVVSVLATEGYFTPVVTAQPDAAGRARFVIQAVAGLRTQVREVELELFGAIEDDPTRLASLRQSWELPVGQPFRDADWTRAKNRLLGKVQAVSWAAARLVDAEAEVDADRASARLRVIIDSGPAFTLGRLSIQGLVRHPAALVQRFNPFTPGDPYDAKLLLDFQRKLQSAPYFSSVLVDVDSDPELSDNVPIRVQLVENKSRRLSFGTGFSTNTGPRLESTYRQIGLFERPWTLQSGVGIDRTRSVAYADVLLPPKPVGDDSYGVLYEKTKVNGLRTRRGALGAARLITREADTTTYETRYTLNLQRELTRPLNPQPGVADDPNAAAGTRNDVLVAGISWTRRDIDHITDPTDGELINLGAAAGLRRSALGQLLDASFLRGYGRYVRYVPLARALQLTARAELGYVQSNQVRFVPQDQLFRTGGASTVRGYSYLSLGNRQGGTTLGAGTLAVGSAELTRWFWPNWGGAAFVDAGATGDGFGRLTRALGYGLGVRWKTVAGPLALDLAYGERTRDGLGGRVRVHFAVAIAF